MTHEDEAEAPPKTRTIRVAISTHASPEQVWQAWTDPEKLAQWFVDRARGEPVLGSTYVWIFEKFGYEIPYQVLEAVPNEKLALGGEPPGRPPFRLEITIEKEGGRTLVMLTNSGFLEGAEWDEEYEGVVTGWSKALETLKFYLENHFGEPKRTVLVLRPAQFAYETLLPYYGTSEGLSRWLARSASMASPGEPYEIVLWDGTRASGRVLLVTRREVAMSWKEIGGVLELMAFSMGPQRMIGVRAMSWKIPSRRELQLEKTFESALERLAAHLSVDAVAKERSKTGRQPPWSDG